MRMPLPLLFIFRFVVKSNFSCLLLNPRLCQTEQRGVGDNRSARSHNVAYHISIITENVSLL